LKKCGRDVECRAMKHQPVQEVQESNNQAIGAWKRFAQGAPKGDFRDTAGVTCAFSNVPLPFLNMAFLSRPVEDSSDLDQRIVASKEYGYKSGLPWMFFSCDNWLPDSIRGSADEVFSGHSLHAAMRLTGMVMDLASAPAPAASVHSSLEYRHVADQETCHAISDINCAAYGMPVEVGRESILEGMFGNDVFAYVGYLEGKPVTAAGVWIVDSVLYVAMVATDPDHRRKGYADAVMWHSLQQARKATGFTRTVLHATEAGLPVYERMGYRIVAGFSVYSEAHE
jgi:ribosomal protein S18 acetylase RimI-like enzyme